MWTIPSGGQEIGRAVEIKDEEVEVVIAFELDVLLIVGGVGMVVDAVIVEGVGINIIVVVASVGSVGPAVGTVGACAKTFNTI